MWSPRSQTITYDPQRLRRNDGKIGLLHEIGHLKLGHRHYTYDMQLLGMEMDAWDFVRHMAPGFGLQVDETHIARCIATYDDWLSKRATCPDCHNFSLQQDRSNFSCFSCGSKWQVNVRLDKRVKRTVIERFHHPRLIGTGLN